VVPSTVHCIESDDRLGAAADAFLLKILIEERLGYPVQLISDGQLDLDLGARSRLELGGVGVADVWSALAAADVDIYPEVCACVRGWRNLRSEGARAICAARVYVASRSVCNIQHTACGLVGIAHRSARCCGLVGIQKVWLSEEFALYNVYIQAGTVRSFVCDPFLVRKQCLGVEWEGVVRRGKEW
jgi:hypothetical protein